jgi:osmotically-inducible protein OsmY
MENVMKKRPHLVLIVALAALAPLACSREQKLDTSETSTSGAHLTPFDQSNADADLQTSAELRRTLIQDSSLSFGAKNVHIITRGGVITLNGAVKNEAERATIEFAARRTSGAVRVDDQLVIESQTQ